MSSGAQNDCDDVLADAARLMREEQDAALAGAGVSGSLSRVGDATWARIAGDLRRVRRRRRWMSVVALQLAIGLGGMGVWAAATGRLTAIVRVPARPPSPETPAKAARPRQHAPALTPAPAEDPPPPVAALVPARPTGAPGQNVRSAARPAAKATPPRAAGVPGVPTKSATTKSATTTDAPATDALYREAHRLHFVRRDFAAALAAWDRYLAAGAGVLALEGRYNRAIALAHLDRRDEAIAALRPFAEGPAGSYRREEARALIDVLGD